MANMTEEQTERAVERKIDALDRRLMTLAQAARPIDDSDWGSNRQVAAQNAFFEHVEGLLLPAAFADLENFCLHASTGEMIDEALRLLVTGDVGRDGR